MNIETATDWAWADQYQKQVVSILKANAMYIVSVSISELDDDLHNATDLVIKITSGNVALRLRRPYYSYRDLTIRSFRPGGKITELAKIRAGFCEWYLYGWTVNNRTIGDWMLINLDALRASGLLDDASVLSREKTNSDGTKFICISSDTLLDRNCIVSHSGFIEQMPSN